MKWSISFWSRCLENIIAPPGTKSHGTFSHKKEIFQSESEVLLLKENNALEMFESERRRDSLMQVMCVR